MPEKRDGLQVLAVQRNIEDAKGQPLALRPLGLSDYVTAREEAFKRYKSNKLKTITDNADSLRAGLGDEEYRQLLRDELQKMSDLSYEDLPEKYVIEYENDDPGIPKQDRVIKKKHPVEYGLWWISSEADGQIFAMWLACRRVPSQADMTLKEMESRFMDDQGQMDQAALERAAGLLGGISEPKLAGNGEAVEPAAEKKKRRRRRRKNRKTG